VVEEAKGAKDRQGEWMRESDRQREREREEMVPALRLRTTLCCVGPKIQVGAPG
jgi:hypothetical protein